MTIGANGRGTNALTFFALDDREIEDEETVHLTVRESENYGIGTDRVASFIVMDKDSSLPTVKISPYRDTATEGDGRYLRFYIQRSDTNGDLEVNYDLSGTATDGVDYTGLTGSVVIPDGAAGVRVDATPIDDAIAEGNETITLSIATSDSYRVGVANT